MDFQYNPLFVVLSVFVAIFASYVALELFNSVNKAQGRTQFVWLTGGALAMGFGIWSMHFIGMLALDMPGMTFAYDIPLLLLSIFIAILASGLALYVVSRRKVTLPLMTLGGFALAAAICGMHYVGMFSMRMGASIQWDCNLVLTSILIAVLASFAALFTATRLRNLKAPFRPQVVASIFMGVAIAGMHYTGMEAATFIHNPNVNQIEVTDLLASSGLAVWVTTTTLLILAVALLTSLVEKALIRRTRWAERNAMLYRAAEAANVTKTRFLANMSHEIRTPIGAILGFSEILLTDDALSTNEQKEYLRIIHRNAVSLSQLLNDILDLSKIEMGRLEVERVPVEIKALVEDVLALLKLKAQEKSLALNWHFDPSTPSQILSDPTRLRQILLNIVGNAVKFTDRGEVTIHQKVLQKNGKSLLAFEVSDSGIGMTEEQKKKLFKPFSQADSSTTRKYGGTGLGLEISKRLAKALNGDVILLESAPLRGSIFLITVGFETLGGPL